MTNQQGQCLYCYQPLTATEQDFHPVCNKKFFGTITPALFPFDGNELDELSKGFVSRTTEGICAQARFFLDIERKSSAQSNTHLSIMSSGGHFILKPPVAAYPYLPELEDLSMHLASIAQIKTASHSLIRLQSGELAYITQRTDRTKKGKLPQEDMCQLSGTLTEDKYQGSMEKIGKMIHTHSSNPGFDVISFFELALFCFLTGNAHMHLKNFSLLSSKENDIGLAPAFNLVPTKLLHPEDKEEMALSINGKKKNLKKSDFDALAEKLKINAKTLDNTYKRFHKALPQMLAFTDLSFLSEEMKQNYKDLIKQRAQELFGFRTEELPKKRPQEVEEKQTIDLIKETAEEFPDQVYKDPFSRQLSLFPI